MDRASSAFTIPIARSTMVIAVTTRAFRAATARKTGTKRALIAGGRIAHLAAWLVRRTRIAQWVCIASIAFVVTRPAPTNAEPAI